MKVNLSWINYNISINAIDKTSLLSLTYQIENAARAKMTVEVSTRYGEANQNVVTNGFDRLQTSVSDIFGYVNNML